MEVKYYDTLPSTSSVAAQAAAEGAGHLFTVTARTQTEGRGRMKRRFFSPVGGLYFTTVLRTALTPREYGGVTPFAALAVARAIERVCGVFVTVKWVNDLLLDGKKVCGILAESGIDQSGAPYVLLGIGINTGDTVFPPELQSIAGSIPCTDKDALLSAVLEELKGVERAVKSGDWVDAYRARCCVLGRNVTLIEGGEERGVYVLDILPSGALYVKEENGVLREVFGGEISLRLTQTEKK